MTYLKTISQFPKFLVIKLTQLYPNKPSVVIRMRVAKYKREQGDLFENIDLEEHVKFFIAEFDADIAVEVT